MGKVRESLARFIRADCVFWMCSMRGINSENPENGSGEKPQWPSNSLAACPFPVQPRTCF